MAAALVGANNRPAAALFFRQRGPTVPKQSLERSGEKLAESAEKIKRSTHGVEDSAARTTELAADRRCITHPSMAFDRRESISRTRGPCCACRYMVRPDPCRTVHQRQHHRRSAGGG